MRQELYIALRSHFLPKATRGFEKKILADKNNSFHSNLKSDWKSVCFINPCAEANPSDTKLQLTGVEDKPCVPGLEIHWGFCC